MIIAFFALVIVATWFERLTSWVRGKSWPTKPVLGCVAVAVLAFGLWDGIPPRHLPYDQINASWNRDANFVKAIEQKMPDGSAIFQLPVLAFPEVIPPGKMKDYDPFRGFLHDDGTLRWSYGAIQGPAGCRLAGAPPRPGRSGRRAAVLARARVHRPVGRHVRLHGRRPEIAQIQGTVGVEPIRSEDGRFLFYDLRPYKARLGRPDASLAAEAKRLLKGSPPPAS